MADTTYDCIVIGGGHNGLTAAAELARGRKFTLCFEAEGLTQEQAYEKEAVLIAHHRRIREGGTLWNYLGGSPGFQGILHDDWREVAARAVATKGQNGARAAGHKAAATRGPDGHRLAGLKAAATRRANKARTNETASWYA